HRPAVTPPLLPYTTLFRSRVALILGEDQAMEERGEHRLLELGHRPQAPLEGTPLVLDPLRPEALVVLPRQVEIDRQGLPEDEVRSEEHTSELQSRFDLVCR